MALTAEELQRIIDIETKLNEIQTHATTLASKTSVRQLGTVNTREFDNLNIKVDSLTPSTEAITTEDLNVFATKEQLKELLLVRNQEINDLQTSVAGSITLSGLTDTTVSATPIEKEVLSYDPTNKWQNKSLSAAGISSTTHNHSLESLSNVSTANLQTGYILQYNQASSSWIPTAQAVVGSGSEGKLPAYDSNSQLVEVSLLTWNSTTNSFEVGSTTTSANIIATGNIQTGDMIIEGKKITGVGTTPVVIDTFNKNIYKTVKYIIEVEDIINSEFLSEEILLIQNETIVNIAEFSIIFTSANNFMTFSAEIDTGTSMVKLSASGISSNNTIKIAKTIIAV
jgi:hypothetical protein